MIHIQTANIVILTAIVHLWYSEHWAFEQR